MKNKIKASLAIGFILLAGLCYKYIYIGFSQKAPISNSQALSLVKNAWGDCQSIPDFCRTMNVKILNLDGAYFVVAYYHGLHTDGAQSMTAVAPIIYKNGLPGLGQKTQVTR